MRLILFTPTKLLIIFKKISTFLSHSRQRKDKICLNCNVEIYGRYCHQCGQENIEPKETAWGLITHFFYDITHFDGKFFSTVKYLLTRPGFLSKEYINGRRASYLHPIRMYVFTSAFFFIVFFSMFKFNDVKLNPKSPAIRDSLTKVLKAGEADALQEARTKSDSDKISGLMRKYEKVAGGIAEDSPANRDSKNEVSTEQDDYETLEAYDSAQKLLPGPKRDGWYKRRTTEKMIAFRQGIKTDRDHFLSNWIDKLIHSFPQLLFISLPLFALLLKLLYFRKKQFYYGDHAIFTIHLYIFTFVSLFLVLVLNQLQKKLGWHWVSYFEVALFLYIIYYTYRAMKNFYMQGFLKTFLKFCLLNIMAFSMIVFLFLAFILLSIFEI